MRQISLRTLLALDAVTCLAMGTGLIALTAPIAGWTGLPAQLIAGAGWLLLPCAALMAAMALRPHPAGIALIVAGNVGWVAASLAVAALSGANGLGVILVLAQALAVAGIAYAERAAWKAAGPAATGDAVR